MRFNQTGWLRHTVCLKDFSVVEKIKKGRRTQVWATRRMSVRYELETNEWPRAQAIACGRGHESAWEDGAEGLMCVWEVHLANA